MDINDLKRTIDKLDARSYELRGDMNTVFKRIADIDARTKQMYDWVKEIRTRYADEGQVNKILDAIRRLK